MTTDTMTPTQAISNAIRSLQHEIIVQRRSGDADPEVITQITEEVAALDRARTLLKEYEALKAALKVALS